MNRLVGLLTFCQAGGSPLMNRLVGSPTGWWSFEPIGEFHEPVEKSPGGCAWCILLPDEPIGKSYQPVGGALNRMVGFTNRSVGLLGLGTLSIA